ncbi:hypothetical protein HMPREF0281_02288 [Corynebacterium ammoniagenes DSM 20306]|uniref:Tyr recombinase domain-containing protein n=1 Tax=Corynebacterium ammoniagenes DSM 20306 TaxID=649754 RepID=A0ABP2IGW5_CORAM|nr:hypothetical protein HMPREF0281_02288 [Corynebacterium ammoniagenes DSM 20306]
MKLLEKRTRGKSQDELLWTAGNGDPLRPLGHTSFFAHAVKRCRKRDELFPRLTPHGLRHVAAGLMVSTGANVKVVQRQLGHASAAMTLDTYADLLMLIWIVPRPRWMRFLRMSWIVVELERPTLYLV